MTEPALPEFDHSRLAGQEWYRNLLSADCPNRRMSVTWCDHLCAMTINLISVAHGDLSQGPCCPLNGQEADLPLTWRFSL